jgi:hypothetical protein
VQKIQLIKKVLENKFAHFGFTFLGSTHRGLWEFRKIIQNDIEQYIRIYLDRHVKHFVYLDISSKYAHGVRVKDFAPEPKYANKQHWEFNDENEFIGILQEMGEIIEKYGLKKLDEISVSPYRFEPTEAMYKRLYEKHEELSVNFKKKHDINESITLKQSLDFIVKLLTTDGEKIYDDDTKEMLLEVAAFYGEQMIKRYSGNWEWHEKARRCAIGNMKHLSSISFVLHNIVQAWENASSKILTDDYEFMINEEKSGYFESGRWIPPKI